MPDLLRTIASTMAAVVFLLTCQVGTAAEAANWVWLGQPQANSKIQLRKSFEITGNVKLGQAAICVDDACVLYVNGQKVAENNTWQSFVTADITSKLVKGKNVIAVEARNSGGSAGAVVLVKVQGDQGVMLEFTTDTSWVGSGEAPANWTKADFDDSSWAKVTAIGVIGDSSLPWSKEINEKSAKAAFDEGRIGSELPSVATHVKVPEGFVVEQLFEVPRSMGSWVSITRDPKGRLIASDQGGAGLFLITSSQDGGETKIEKLPIKLSGFQGMTWAFDSLYGVINGGEHSGLHRMWDSNGDGIIDASEHLIPIAGGGEHGPHAIIPSPDGKSLHLCAGNHTKLPEGITGSKIPQNWGEDLLLPRRWDANGHAAGILAPGGWVMKIDPKGKEREIISVGYRNQYDIAFNADGELFSYDADMEWDFGAPWYRPTRAVHATSGSEFGWRSGTGKWPAYYEDSLPGVVDLGPGSPVGVTFGYGTKFPAKYQKALFLLDWTYSMIYAVHLTPDGSSYKATTEEFAVGQPMQVTDAIIGADGAFYFAAGGRGTQSTLYRIRYAGNEPTAPVDAKDAEGKAERDLRHQLEAMHGHAGGDLNLILAHLGSPDRFLRYAARIALEFQPVDSWRQRVLTDMSLPALARIDGVIALARQGKPEDQTAAIAALNAIDYAAQDEVTRLAMLRAYQLVFIRLGTPSETNRVDVIAKMNPLYPAATYAENAELSQLMVYLNAPGVVRKTLQVMRELGPEQPPAWQHLVTRSDRYGGTIAKMMADMPPTRAIHFAFVLRNQKEQWTMPEREEYFQFFIGAAKHPGGNSFGRFLSQMRDDAILTCSPSERVALQAITSASLIAEPPQVAPPQGPGRKWTREEALEALGPKLSKRNYAKGRQIYFAVSCGKCHRLDGEGGSIGPDLSTAGTKFPMPDLLDSIIEPSKVISDQYASHQVVTTNGQVLQGRAVEIGDELYVYTPDADAPPKVIKKSEIDEMQPSPISQMPVGLVDSLNPEELKDLLAYLLSGGDQRHAVFR
ncbi:c-type cytochrome [Planctomicrobium sp. SH527]|uniref:c-type cytochrome n=1 Tax=Planctomicrobium sp. SH527 TaxID=3448123 RepID=UPI003F5C7C60